jgi:DNA polymerase I-like protein with 3'-5' exonuclease and polymerase domains
MRAMIKVQNFLDENPELTKGIAIIMNIHDELVFKAPKRNKKTNMAVFSKIRRIMEKVGDYVGIPLTCGVSYFEDNWGTSN